MSKQTIVEIRPSAGGLRRFAVASATPVVEDAWYSNTDIASQSDQSWAVAVWERVDGRGYVARLTGDGQWANRGDHGVYVGTGPTAAAALEAAWSADSGRRHGSPPRNLLAAARDHDAAVAPPAVE